MKGVRVLSFKQMRIRARNSTINLEVYSARARRKICVRIASSSKYVPTMENIKTNKKKMQAKTWCGVRPCLMVAFLYTMRFVNIIS